MGSRQNIRDFFLNRMREELPDKGLDPSESVVHEVTVQPDMTVIVRAHGLSSRAVDECDFSEHEALVVFPVEEFLTKLIEQALGLDERGFSLDDPDFRWTH